MTQPKLETLPAKSSERELVDQEFDGAIPAIIGQAGNAARFAFEEFLFGKIRNAHTRKAYLHSTTRFLTWCERRGLRLEQIAPSDVGRFIDSLACAPSTKKVHLAAIRHLFDELVNRHAVILNPATSVRGEREQTVEGKTPEITLDHARKLLHSLDTENTVGLRDRAIIGILIYTAARVGAVSRLKRQNFYDSGSQPCLRFNEKGGKSREIPVRQDLEQFITEYLQAAGLCDADKNGPLFRSAAGRTKSLTQSVMTAGDIGRMVKRRMRDAGLPAHLSPHSFRVTTITDLLTQGVPLEDVQHLAGHADPRTTRLYDRRQANVSRNIVDRISV